MDCRLPMALPQGGLTAASGRNPRFSTPPKKEPGQKAGSRRSSQWYHWKCLFGGHRRPRGDKAVAFRAVRQHRSVRAIALVENLGPRREFEADAVGAEAMARADEEPRMAVGRRQSRAVVVVQSRGECKSV